MSESSASPPAALSLGQAAAFLSLMKAGTGGGQSKQGRALASMVRSPVVPVVTAHPVISKANQEIAKRHEVYQERNLKQLNSLTGDDVKRKTKKHERVMSMIKHNQSLEQAKAEQEINRAHAVVRQSEANAKFRSKTKRVNKKRTELVEKQRSLNRPTDGIELPDHIQKRVQDSIADAEERKKLRYKLLESAKRKHDRRKEHADRTTSRICSMRFPIKLKESLTFPMHANTKARKPYTISKNKKFVLKIKRPLPEQPPKPEPSADYFSGDEDSQDQRIYVSRKRVR